MLYVKRDETGRIIKVSHDPEPGLETLAEGHRDLLDFVAPHLDTVGAEFKSLDAAFVRVIEDLIDVLIQKNLIRLTDLPREAQLKVLGRKSTRAQLGGIGALVKKTDVL